jgi:hypothetical protein
LRRDFGAGRKRIQLLQVNHRDIDFERQERRRLHRGLQSCGRRRTHKTFLVIIR